MYLSFVAPAYKVDKYLDDFFSSFINFPTNIDFEIVLVNDEPNKDLSSWLKKYSKLNINLINNPVNIGQGPSRLVGVSKVSESSTHVIFIDPDDKISNTTFIKYIKKEQIVQFGKNRWFVNKKVYESPDGDVSEYKLDNVIHGISFPIDIAKVLHKYSKEDESNDMPIKLRMAKDFEFSKTQNVMIDYRIRKSSTINSRRSERRAREEINTWEHLGDEGFVNKEVAFNNMYFELVINKKSFDKNWFKDKKTSLLPKVSLLTRFNSTMYKLVSFWKIKNLIINVLTNRKMFD